MNICDFIPRGRENAIRRADLVARLNLPDRKVREMIETARKDGALILNDSSGQGYFISDDIGEIKRQYLQDKHRALSILNRAKHMRRVLKEAGEDV